MYTLRQADEIRAMNEVAEYDLLPKPSRSRRSEARAAGDLDLREAARHEAVSRTNTRPSCAASSTPRSPARKWSRPKRRRRRRSSTSWKRCARASTTVSESKKKPAKAEIAETKDARRRSRAEAQGRLGRQPRARYRRHRHLSPARRATRIDWSRRCGRIDGYEAAACRQRASSPDSPRVRRRDRRGDVRPRAAEALRVDLAGARQRVVEGGADVLGADAAIELRARASAPAAARARRTPGTRGSSRRTASARSSMALQAGGVDRGHVAQPQDDDRRQAVEPIAR